MVTSNANKALEVAAYFGGNLEVDHVALEMPEHRSEDVAEIARGKAEYAYRQLRRPLIVDDTAFCIDALNGFPGPYAAYVLNTIGNPGILKLMEAVDSYVPMPKREVEKPFQCAPSPSGRSTNAWLASVTGGVP